MEERRGVPGSEYEVPYSFHAEHVCSMSPAQEEADKLEQGRKVSCQQQMFTSSKPWSFSPGRRGLGVMGVKNRLWPGLRLLRTDLATATCVLIISQFDCCNVLCMWQPLKYIQNLCAATRLLSGMCFRNHVTSVETILLSSILFLSSVHCADLEL